MTIKYKPIGGSGWLNPFTQKKGDKLYPRIPEGSERGDLNNYPNHYYWRYCYYDNNGKNKSVSIPVKILGKVKYLIDSNKPVDEILYSIKLLKSNKNTP